MTAIRRETPADVRAVRTVNEQAFGRPAEADLVDRLRDRGAVTLSLMAVLDGEIVGHILFSPLEIVSGEARHHGVALGPMAVLPAHQRRGIGSRLVRAGLERLREGGEELVIVLGHAEYYPRFGFTRASTFGIRCPLDVPDEVFLALELRPGAARGRSGVVRYAPEFDEV